MPLFGLGILILWLGWFGFNPGSTLNAKDGRFAEIAARHAARGRCRRAHGDRHGALEDQAIDIGMAGNGAIAALVAITARSGYVDPGRRRIGLVAGVIVVLSVYAIDRRIHDPVGALSAHGVAGIWGTLACGFFTAPPFAAVRGIGDPDGGLVYSGTFAQLGYQALGVVVVFAPVFVASLSSFWAIKKTIGMRVTAEEEDAGLDITEHGMYGYPEQFIPAPSSSATVGRPVGRGRRARHDPTPR